MRSWQRYAERIARNPRIYIIDEEYEVVAFDTREARQRAGVDTYATLREVPWAQASPRAQHLADALFEREWNAAVSEAKQHYE